MYLADNNIDRYRARLFQRVTLSFRVLTLNYFDTFCRVKKLTIVRTLLAIASIQNVHLKQLYVNNAFIYEDLRSCLVQSRGRIFIKGRGGEGKGGKRFRLYICLV